MRCRLSHLMIALAIVVMKQADVAQKHQQDMQDWQRRGAGGIVSTIDASAGTILLDVNLPGTPGPPGDAEGIPGFVSFQSAMR